MNKLVFLDFVTQVKSKLYKAQADDKDCHANSRYERKRSTLKASLKIYSANTIFSYYFVTKF